MALVDTYQSLLALSRRMVESAIAEDWDSLLAMETERLALSAQLPMKLPSMPPADAQAIAQAIRDILECTQRVEEHARPWMDHVGGLLKAFGADVQA